MSHFCTIEEEKLCSNSILQYYFIHTFIRSMSTVCCVVVQMLVVFRNPKDTLVSFFHFYNNNPVLPSAKSWESFYSDFMSGDGELVTDYSVLIGPHLMMRRYMKSEVCLWRLLVSLSPSPQIHQRLLCTLVSSAVFMG